MPSFIRIFTHIMLGPVAMVDYKQSLATLSSFSRTASDEKIESERRRETGASVNFCVVFFPRALFASRSLSLQNRHNYHIPGQTYGSDLMPLTSSANFWNEKVLRAIPDGVSQFCSVFTNLCSSFREKRKIRKNSQGISH